MEGMIAGRTASDMPGLDIAEQRSWQNFLDSALRMYATLNRSLVDAHHLTLNDVRLLDMLDKSATGSARMGDLADGLMSLPSRVTRQIRRLGTAGPGASRRQSGRRPWCAASITEEGQRGGDRSHGDVRPGGTHPLPRPTVSPPDRRDGGELQTHQRRAEDRRAAGEARSRLTVRSSRRPRRPVLLSAVAWQSGLMHSP